MNKRAAILSATVWDVSRSNIVSRRDNSTLEPVEKMDVWLQLTSRIPGIRSDVREHERGARRWRW